MMRDTKRSPKWLIIAGTFILVGHWLDIFLMIMPGVVGNSAEGVATGFGPLEIGIPMAFAGIFLYTVQFCLSKANLYAINHPYILESATYDTGA